MAALTKKSFHSVLRLVLKKDAGALGGLRHETWRQMKQVGIKRDLTKAATRTPKGSDQVDIQSLVQWIRKVDKSDPVSMKQLEILDATLVSRTS